MTAPTTVMLAPSDITVDSNIRKNVKVDKSFWASVNQDGVIVPVIVERRDDETLHLIDGQRRILAALDSGHNEIPATIIDTAKNDGQHIIRQLVVNEHREQLTDADRVAATQTLFELGLSADQIARKTKTPKARVETALKVIASESASKAIANAPSITLEHAAALAEFDDSPEIAEQLTTIAVDDPGRFDHTVSRLRDDRKIEAAQANAVAELQAAGVTVIPRPDYNDNTIVLVRDLSPTAAAAKSYTSFALNDHLTCPGHAIAVHAYLGWDAGNERKVTVDQLAYCTDWKQKGLLKVWLTPVRDS